MHFAAHPVYEPGAAVFCFEFAPPVPHECESCWALVALRRLKSSVCAQSSSCALRPAQSVLGTPPSCPPWLVSHSDHCACRGISSSPLEMGLGASTLLHCRCRSSVLVLSFGVFLLRWRSGMLLPDTVQPLGCPLCCATRLSPTVCWELAVG